MSQPPYNPGQPNQQQPNQMYNPNMMNRMQQQGMVGMQQGYGQNMQYPQMMGQPGPQMTGMGTPGQPRSPMVHSLQAQSQSTGQPSPLAGGPHSHLGPGSIGPHGGPLSTGPHSVHGAPHSIGPASVLGGPQSVPGGPSSLMSGPHSVPGGGVGPLSVSSSHPGGPQSLGSSFFGNPASVQGGPQSIGGPNSVLGPHSNLAPQSTGPLSVHGGPASTGEFLGNPPSVQIQQPMSITRVLDDPRSVGPHSVNQPSTPMNPASAQMPASHTPATPSQLLRPDAYPDPTVLTAVDPIVYARELILRDLRQLHYRNPETEKYEIIFQKFSKSMGDFLKEKRGEYAKPSGQMREDMRQALDNLLAVVDDVENSLTVVADAPKQAARLDKAASETKDKNESPMQYTISQQAKMEELLRKTMQNIAATRNTLASRQAMHEEQSVKMEE